MMQSSASDWLSRCGPENQIFKNGQLHRITWDLHCVIEFLKIVEKTSIVQSSTIDWLYRYAPENRILKTRQVQRVTWDLHCLFGSLEIVDRTSTVRSGATDSLYRCGPENRILKTGHIHRKTWEMRIYLVLLENEIPISRTPNLPLKTFSKSSHWKWIPFPS